jgi:uncharacterized membrane protein required for colicin V production
MPRQSGRISKRTYLLGGIAAAAAIGIVLYEKHKKKSATNLLYSSGSGPGPVMPPMSEGTMIATVALAVAFLALMVYVKYRIDAGLIKVGGGALARVKSAPGRF